MNTPEPTAGVRHFRGTDQRKRYPTRASSVDHGVVAGATRKHAAPGSDNPMITGGGRTPPAVQQTPQRQIGWGPDGGGADGSAGPGTGNGAGSGGGTGSMGDGEGEGGCGPGGGGTVMDRR